MATPNRKMYLPLVSEPVDCDELVDAAELKGSRGPSRQGTALVADDPEEQALRWLLEQASDTEVFRALGKLSVARPGILEHVTKLAQTAAEMTKRTPDGTHSEPLAKTKAESPFKEKEQANTSVFKPLPLERPILQFSSFIYLADESEKLVTLEVVRLGDHTKRSVVQWRTKDGSAVAGDTYK
ncbi:unnamed protein product, partial [Polarella glacialis]